MADKNENRIEKVENKKSSSPRYKTEKCKILSYDKFTKELDVDFKGYGIRLKNVDKVDSDFISIKYRGEIGASNFTYKL